MKVVRKILEWFKFRNYPLSLAPFLVILSLSGILFFWFIGGRTERAMIERFKAREQTLASSGALGIREFLEERKTEILLLSQIEAIQALKENEGRRIIEDHLKREGERMTVGGIVRVSKEGKAVWTVNLKNLREDEGTSLSDRDYFLWAKSRGKPGEVFVSQPVVSRIGVTKGKRILVMATPVFYLGRFNGALILSLPLENLLTNFVVPLSFSPKVQGYLVDKEGITIVSTDALGEGRKIATFAPINFGEQSWSLWISAPYEEAAKLLWSFKVNQLLGVVFFVVLFLSLAFLFVWGVRTAQKDSFLNGYARAKDDFDRKKKS